MIWIFFSLKDGKLSLDFPVLTGTRAHWLDSAAISLHPDFVCRQRIEKEELLNLILTSLDSQPSATVNVMCVSPAGKKVTGPPSSPNDGPGEQERLKNS